MTDPAHEPIADLGELLVHALELEHEAAERFTLLADSMAMHHNAAVSGLFRDLAARAAQRAVDLSRRASGIALPRIAPWSFKWYCPGQPREPDCLAADVSYRMSAVEALRATIYNETRGHVFYAHVAATTPDPDAAALAAELAAEQVRHLEALGHRLAAEARHETPTLEDLDPPHVAG